MRTTTLPPVAAVDAVYRLAEPEVRSFAVACPPLYEFHHALRALESLLEENVLQEDEYWLPLLRYLRRYRFQVSATPLSFSDPAVHDQGRLQAFRESLSYCHLQYPEYADAKDSLFRCLDRLLENPANPLQRALLALLAPTQGPAASTAIVLSEPRLIAPVEAMLRRPGRPLLADVVGPNAFRGTTTTDRMIITGLPRWYPDYLFGASRTRQIVVMAFGWLRDDWSPSPLFVSTDFPLAGPKIKSGGSGASAPTPEERDIRPLMANAAQLLHMAELMQSTTAGNDADEIEMQLFLLEGGQGVFLEDSDTTRALVIDLEADTLVRRINVAEIQPGMFLLLRTYGGGDYILPLADRLLGDAACPARAMQEEWKEGLRKQVRADEPYAICNALTELGAVRASENNVQNWMWSRSIRPREEADFHAVLLLTGLGDRREEYRRNARQILRAHMRAGTQVRRQLLERVRTTDLRTLESCGRMDFPLQGVEGISLTALRVESRPSVRVSLPSHRAGQLFEVEDGKWHA